MYKFQFIHTKQEVFYQLRTQNLILIRVGKLVRQSNKLLKLFTSISTFQKLVVQKLHSRITILNLHITIIPYILYILLQHASQEIIEINRPLRGVVEEGSIFRDNLIHGLHSITNIRVGRITIGHFNHRNT